MGDIMNIGIMQILLIFALIILFFVARFLIKLFKSQGKFLSNSENLQPSGDPTRYALASLYLKGANFRRELLEIEKHPTRAMSPEPGLDYNLVMAACRSIHKSEFLIGFLITILAVIFIFSFLGNLLSFYIAFPTLIYLLIFEPSMTVMHLSFYMLTALSMFKIWHDQFRKILPFRRENFDIDSLRREYQSEIVNAPKQGYPKNGNVRCFGTIAPFLGSGIRLEGWQITTKLVPENPSQTRSESFNSELFHNRISSAIHGLGIKRCTQQNVLFINGTEIGQLAREDQIYQKLFLPSPFKPPRMVITEKAFPMLHKRNDERLRTYSEFAIHGWNGEIIMSNFVRAEVDGSSLTVEIAPVFLPPVHRDFREVDVIRNLGFWAAIKWFFVTLLKMPIYWVQNINSTILSVQEFISDSLSLRQSHEFKEIRLNPAYNYGAVSSIRTMISSRIPHFYFQEADAKRYKNMLEKAVLVSVIDTLKQNGYSTADFENQSVNITDNSVSINSSGNVDVSGAIGKGAQRVVGESLSRVLPKGR